MKIPAIGSSVKLEWFDTTSLPGWHYFHKGEPIDTSPRLQISRGVLVAAGPVAITIAGTVSPMGALDSKTGCMDLLIIPRGCVTRVQVIP